MTSDAPIPIDLEFESEENRVTLRLQPGGSLADLISLTPFLGSQSHFRGALHILLDLREVTPPAMAYEAAHIGCLLSSIFPAHRGRLALLAVHCEASDLLWVLCSAADRGGLSSCLFDCEERASSWLRS